MNIMLLRDPLHGDIELSALEAAVLDLPVMQRLRGIKQLGTAHLVYPGALHTRFDHSIGVCAVAHRMVDALRRSGHHVDADMEDAIGAAALLHDVTHVPFGHTLEDERRLFDRHDKGSRLTDLSSRDLGDALTRLGVRDTVGSLLGMQTQADAPQWAKDIVSGSIDADLLDYLRRDSYFAGLSQDYDDRIFRCFGVGEGRLIVRLARHGMDRPDAHSEIVSVLRLRYYLTERVYFHHTKVVAGAMISKAVELAIEHAKLSENDLLELNDWTLLDRLAHCGVQDAQTLARRTSNRELLKRGYVVSGKSIPIAQRRSWVKRFHLAHTERAELEAALARELGVPFSDVILYCPALSAMKEASVPVETSQGFGNLDAASSVAHAEIAALQERYSDLWRFYVFVPETAVSRAEGLVNELLGVPSELATRPKVD
jgi:uncharacterized protein